MFLFQLLVLSNSTFHVHLCVGVTDIRGDMQRTQRGWTWVRPRRQRELVRCVGVVKGLAHLPYRPPCWGFVEVNLGCWGPSCSVGVSQPRRLPDRCEAVLLMHVRAGFF